jgi:ketosteroid isomerase-like protein
MSAEENKALARRFLEAQASGDLDTLDELMAPDFVDRSVLPGQGSSREDYKRSVVDMLGAFPEGDRRAAGADEHR